MKTMDRFNRDANFEVEKYSPIFHTAISALHPILIYTKVNAVKRL